MIHRNNFTSASGGSRYTNETPGSRYTNETPGSRKCKARWLFGRATSELTAGGAPKTADSETKFSDMVASMESLILILNIEKVGLLSGPFKSRQFISRIAGLLPPSAAGAVLSDPYGYVSDLVEHPFDQVFGFDLDEPKSNYRAMQIDSTGWLAIGALAFLFLFGSYNVWSVWTIGQF